MKFRLSQGKYPKGFRVNDDLLLEGNIYNCEDFPEWTVKEWKQKGIIEVIPIHGGTE
jgi:hypothetical protein